MFICYRNQISQVRCSLFMWFQQYLQKSRSLISMEKKVFVLLLLVALCNWISIVTGTATGPSRTQDQQCAKGHWKCKTGECIHELRKCDGIKNCKDGSDEKEGCHGVYCNTETHFLCKSGRCIDKEEVCDGAEHCEDGDDESICKEEFCEENHFKCNNGHCIPNSYLCDEKPDCLSGEDEKNCSAKKCSSGEASCNDGKCIPNYQFCDGEFQCLDGEDEEKCGNNTEHCTIENGLFMCYDRSKCMELDWLCDGSNHCHDGSDEDGECNIRCKKNQCQYKCKRSPSGPLCSCRKGYKLKKDKKSCRDIDECDGNQQVCDHFCKNIPGGYRCSCANDYEEMDNGATCRIRGAATLIYTLGNRVEATLLDGSRSWIISRGNMKTTGVAYDPKTKNVYWIEYEKIMFIQLDLTNSPKVFINQGLRSPINLAIDWYSRNLYVADEESKHILACNLESKGCLRIVNQIGGPRSLQLDLENRFLYWTDVRSHKIEKVWLDGTHRSDFVNDEKVFWPNGLAIDHPARRIYWADPTKNQIRSSDLKGGNRKSVSIGESHVYSLAVWQDRLYWTDMSKSLKNEIKSCGKRDCSLKKTEHKNTNKVISSLVIYHESMYPKITNPCENGFTQKCSHICFLTKSTNGYICACPEEMELREDKHSCYEKRFQIPVVALHSNLYELTLRSYGKSKAKQMKNVPLVGSVTDMDYDPRKNELLIADRKREVISSVNLKENKETFLGENIKNPISVAIDWLRGNLYWISGLHNTVEVMRSSGHHRLTVIDSLSNPMDLALDLVGGFLFVINAGLKACIVKCDLDGNKCVTLVDSEILKPSSICIDTTVKSEKLYWTDIEKNTIESIDVFGNDRKTEFHKLIMPMKVLVTEEYIFFTEKRMPTLFIKSKANHAEDHNVTIELSNYAPDEWYMPLSVILTKPHSNYDSTTYTGKGVLDNPCPEDKCQQFCFSRILSQKVCGCSSGFVLDSDGTTCNAAECEHDDKKCDDGECQLEFYWCDGTADCEDGSDERNCPGSLSCAIDEYKCQNGQCIAKDKKCNGHFDCKDKSDEGLYCPRKNCRKGEEWKCNNGECIPLSLRCDAVTDCEDGSDEKSCDSCSGFRCSDGECIDKDWKCDGFKDCTNAEDEHNCACSLGEHSCKGICEDIEKICQGEVSCGNQKDNLSCEAILRVKLSEETCPLNYVKCNSQSKSPCIPYDAWCNGTPDCENAEDEKNCGACDDDLVECEEEKSCIQKSSVCDGHNDCKNGSDELRCPSQLKKKKNSKTKGSCSAKEFECSDGKCISVTNLCNGIKECLNGDDEDGECNKCNDNNGGCLQVCNNHPIKATCSCNPGYSWSSDLFTCLDIDECEDENICHHQCKNTLGSYTCRCQNGYSLMSDGITCKSLDGKTWKSAVMSNGKLQYLSAGLKLLKSEPLSQSVTSLHYDPGTETLYGINEPKGIIFKLDSQNQWQMMKKSNIQSIAASSIDFMNKNIYIVKQNIFRNKRSGRERIINSAVKVYNVEKKRFGHLFDHQKTISAIGISITHKELIMCVKDSENCKVIAANMDGSHERELVTKKIKGCNSLVVDDLKKRIYWLDDKLKRIESVDLLGSNRKRFLTKEISESRGLALFDRSLMWYNSRQKALVKCSIKTPTLCTEIALDVTAFTTLTPVDHSASTPCSPSTCQHICVPAATSTPHCFCADGYTDVNGTCQEVKIESKLKGDCMENPCNKGSCTTLSRGYIKCKCPDDYRGPYCEVTVAKTVENRKNVLLIVLLVLFIGLAVAVGLIFFYKKSSKKFWKKDGFRIRFIRSSFEPIHEEDSGLATPPITRKKSMDSTCDLEPSQVLIGTDTNSPIYPRHKNPVLSDGTRSTRTVNFDPNQ